MRLVLYSKSNKIRLKGSLPQQWLERVKKDLNQVDETTSLKETDNIEIIGEFKQKQKKPKWHKNAKKKINYL